MRKIILAATIVGFSMGGALAQTGPTPQNNNMKQNDTMSKDTMSKDGMKKEHSGTSGMSKDTMSKDGMKDKSKENKPVDGMKK